MTKKIILLFATCLFTTSCLFGCGDENKPADDNPTTATKVESTTKEDVATTEPTTAEPTTPPETTTQEPTTEEPSTEYVWKSEGFVVDASLKDYFMDLTIQKGDKIYLNDIMGKDEGDEGDRGTLALDLVRILYKENHIEKYQKFVETYRVDGTAEYIIPYDDNMLIEHDVNEKMYFHFIEENNGWAVFDVYEID